MNVRQKRFFIKIYDLRDRRKAIITDFQFGGYDWSINGGLGELLIRLPREIDDFGESNQIDFFYRLELYVTDLDTTAVGKRIYQGYIVSYDLISDRDSEYVEVKCLGYQALLEKIILKDGTTTTVSYSGQDLSYILKDAIEKANSTVTTSSTSIENTGQSPSYTFRTNTVMEVIDKVIDLAPDGYFWYVDADSILHFKKAKFDKPDIQIKFRRDIMSLQVSKSANDMYNASYFIGGGSPNLFQKMTRTSSQDTFGILEGRHSDERVTLSDTADRIQTVFLDKQDHPKVTVKLTISDNHLRKLTGIDLEALRPGMVMVLRNLVDPRDTLWDVATWDVDYWDFDVVGAVANPLVITRIQYRIDQATIEMGSFMDTFYRQYVSLEDKVSTVQYQNLPSAPS